MMNISELRTKATNLSILDDKCIKSSYFNQLIVSHLLLDDKISSYDAPTQIRVSEKGMDPRVGSLKSHNQGPGDTF